MGAPGARPPGGCPGRAGGKIRLYEAQRLKGRGLVVGHDHGHRLPVVAYPAARQRRLVAHVEAYEHLRPVGAGERAAHAGKGQGGGAVYAVDFGVGVGAVEHGRVEGARAYPVVGIAEGAAGLGRRVCALRRTA
jgi:hypothetical protein